MKFLFLVLIPFMVSGCASTRYIRIEAHDGEIRPSFMNPYVPRIKADKIIFWKAVSNEPFDVPDQFFIEGQR